jgi:hypothetical protein
MPIAAPFAPQCQSFLDNFPAGLGARGSANDPAVGDRSWRYADRAGEEHRTECCCHDAGTYIARQFTRRAKVVAIFWKWT